MSNETITQTGYMIEKLNPSELRKLKKMVLGYGNFTATANKIGIHRETLRGIIDRGHGQPDSIEKIRTVLQAA